MLAEMPLVQCLRHPANYPFGAMQTHRDDVDNATLPAESVDPGQLLARLSNILRRFFVSSEDKIVDDIT
jgi:hypothetical protein